MSMTLRLISIFYDCYCGEFSRRLQFQFEISSDRIVERIYSQCLALYLFYRNYIRHKFGRTVWIYSESI